MPNVRLQPGTEGLVVRLEVRKTPSSAALLSAGEYVAKFGEPPGAPGTGAAGRGGADRGWRERPGGREAVPGVADVGEPVAAGAGGPEASRRWPRKVRTGPGAAGRARLIYRTHLDRGSGRHRRKGFTETDYARLLDAAYQQIHRPIVLIWDNLPTHASRAMRQLFGALSVVKWFGPTDRREFRPRRVAG